VPRLVAGLFVAGAVGLAAFALVARSGASHWSRMLQRMFGYGWVAAVFVAATVLTSGALLRAAGRIFLGRGQGPRGGRDRPRGE
jgi:hypothetical protein